LSPALSSLKEITNEHIIFGTSDFYVHLCLLFNSLLRHCFVPAEFCFGAIIPLLKNKHGDVASSDMYRGISLSSTVSKLFARVLLDLFGDYLQRCCNMITRKTLVA